MLDTDEIYQTKRKAARGSIIIFLLTVIAFPLLYIRNWFLSHIGTQAEVVGAFALIILMQQGILTFLFFGGRNVITTYYPKLKNNMQRTGFLNNYYRFIFIATLIGISIIIFWPRAIETIFHHELNIQTKHLLLLFVPVVLLSHLGNSFLTGMQFFGLATLFARSELFIMTLVIGLFYFFAPEELIQRPLLILGGVLLSILLTNAVLALIKIYKNIEFSKSFHIPPNSIRFGIFAHLETITTYIYISMDQFFVLQKFDIGKLGQYFVLLQLARIVPLSVQIFGNVILTTFSSLLANDNRSQAISAYRKISRLSIAFHFLISLVLVLFARQIASIFGASYAENNRYLIWLAFNMNLGSMHTIASKYATSHEKMNQLFYAQLFQIIIQFATTLLLIGTFNTYGIIAGKGIGILIANVSLFFIVARIGMAAKTFPPFPFFMSHILLFCAAVYTHIYQQSWLLSSVLFAAICFAFASSGKYRIREFTSVVKLSFSKKK